MALFTATDDPNLGAPTALSGPNDAFVLLAPDSCTVDATVAPPSYTFSRCDYSWLALALASSGDPDRLPAFLDQVYVGTHTLSWLAMHATVAQAITAGFQVSGPSDVVNAVKQALMWSETHTSLLRPVAAVDFELLPALPQGSGLLWWCNTPYSLWTADGLFQSLCHLYGYSGPVWDVQSRLPDSRLQLCMLLTQEFIPVSASLPAALYGEPASRFFQSTMLPHRFLRFPSGISGLLNSLTIRWGYFHGSAFQCAATLLSLLPAMLKECNHLRRFLQPCLSVSSQVSAYTMIAELLGPFGPVHKFETFLQVDKRLSSYLTLADQADAAVEPVHCDLRAIMLKDAIECERTAIASAPQVTTGGTKGETEGPATRRIITALVAFRGEPFVVTLEKRLESLWTPTQQRPTEVFEAAIASRSVTCIAILFSNVTGVSEAGSVFSILEQAALHRLQYFTYKLATPEREVSRPDHTRWFSYPQRYDTWLRASDLDTFKKINFLELGAQIRRLREKVKYETNSLPKAGQEFGFEDFHEHLLLLNFLQPWLEALGFEVHGKSSFLEAMRVFSLFCQHGLHYKGRARELHRDHMRQLYQALLTDLHQSMKPFWKEPLLVYNLSMTVDAMFPAEGAFYAAHRDLKLEVAEQDRLAHMGYVPQAANTSSIGSSAQVATGSRRPGPSQDGSRNLNDETRYRDQSSIKPPFSEVGSFSYAVKEDTDTVSILGIRYAKRLILEKLGLKDDEICLPYYLSKKGAAACPYSSRAGHERIDSHLHLFSEAAMALRPVFEQAPFRLPREDASAIRGPPRNSSGVGRSRGRAGNRGQARLGDK